MKSNHLILICVFLLSCLNVSDAKAQVAAFDLPDLDGNRVKLERCESKQTTVVCFLGTECPLAKLYASRLNTLASEFETIQFIGVSSNLQDSLRDLQEFKDRHQIGFPMIKDQDQSIAAGFAATRTPEVFLLDRELKIRYRGRIDDQYLPGIAKSKPRRHDLRIAISELLADQPVSLPSTQPEGCLIGRVNRHPNVDGTVTYTNQISRILQHHCSECHRAGQIGPMELASYDEVVGWADMILEVVSENRMPPWHADPDHGSFVNERRLTAAEKKILREWIAAGTPFGDLAELPPARELVDSNHWKLPKQPDLVVAMRSQPFIVPAEGTVEYQYFVADPALTEDTWVTAAEIIPGEHSVLHHSIVFVRPPDGDNVNGIGWLAAYVPGQSAPTFNPKFGRKIPAGSRFVFQQHYTPNGKPTADITRIGLVFGKEQEIENEVFTLLAMNQDFVIPPHEDNYTTGAKFGRLPKHGSLLGLSPHMHVRGKSFELTATRAAENPDPAAVPTTEILLRVPNYDFNWQPIYQLQNPIPLDQIQSLEFVATFDNSADNPANPDPTEQVTWGDYTWEEMAVAFAIVALPRRLKETTKMEEQQQQKLEWNRRLAKIEAKVDEFVIDYFERFDTNRDGLIHSNSEYPRSIRDHGAWQIDVDRDQVVTPEEVRQAAKQHYSRKLPIQSFAKQ